MHAARSTHDKLPLHCPPHGSHMPHMTQQQPAARESRRVGTSDPGAGSGQQRTGAGAHRVPAVAGRVHEASDAVLMLRSCVLHELHCMVEPLHALLQVRDRLVRLEPTGLVPHLLFPACVHAALSSTCLRRTHQHVLDDRLRLTRHTTQASTNLTVSMMHGDRAFVQAAGLT